MAALAPGATVLSSCIGCQAGTEYIHREIEGGIHLMTFIAFILVSAKGIIFEKRMIGARQHIPTREYMAMVVLFFIVNQANNYSLYFDVSMPLFIIFKSGSLLANLLLARVIRRQTHSWSKICAILVTTIGLAIFTLASSLKRPAWSAQPPEWTRWLPFPAFWIGVLLMSTALVLSAYLGIMQEDLFRTYGRHHQEALFFVHFLSLPGFALVGDKIYAAARSTALSEDIQILDFPVPIWVIVAGTSFLHLLCSSSVFRLATIRSSLEVTMLLSIRKALSVQLSIYFFENHFTSFHYFGAAAVFLGSALFYL